MWQTMASWLSFMYLVMFILVAIRMFVPVLHQTLFKFKMPRRIDLTGVELLMFALAFTLLATHSGPVSNALVMFFTGLTIFRFGRFFMDCRRRHLGILGTLKALVTYKTKVFVLKTDSES